MKRAVVVMSAISAASVACLLPPRARSAVELEYSTYLGGSGFDQGLSVALDSSGTVFVAGTTYSADLPTENPYQAVRTGNSDAFISRLSSAGSSIIFSTYLGGSGDDGGYGIAVESGIAFVIGYTDSTDFPTLNAYQVTNAGNKDAFVSRFSPTGSAFIYSTYLGGSGGDYGYGIAVEVGIAYLTGATSSGNFPTLNAYQASNAGGDDVFVSRLSPTGTGLLYSTYLGGGDGETGYGIAVESESVHVTGWTYSSDLPVLNAYQSSNAGSDDVFVSCFSSTGSALVYSTYLGGSDSDYGYGIAVESGASYITGETNSSDFLMWNAYQASYVGGNDVYISHLSSTGSVLVYSTYLGGNSGEAGRKIAVESGLVCVTGETYSSNFPTSNAYQSSYGGSGDAFVSRLSFSGSVLLYSTYFGGNKSDFGYGIAVESPAAIITGWSNSTNLPVLGAYQPGNAGSSDVFVSRMRYPTPPPPSPTPTCGPTVSQPDTIIQSGDYDGEGTNDIAIFRPSTGLWSVRGFGWAYFGGSADVPVPGDYDGDGTWEVAIFRPWATALWHLRGVSRFYYGKCLDYPVRGDFDGGGKGDPGIFRQSIGLWSIRDVSRLYWGTDGDIPATR